MKNTQKLFTTNHIDKNSGINKKNQSNENFVSDLQHSFLDVLEINYLTETILHKKMHCYIKLMFLQFKPFCLFILNFIT